MGGGEIKEKNCRGGFGASRTRKKNGAGKKCVHPFVKRSDGFPILVYNKVKGETEALQSKDGGVMDLGGGGGKEGKRRGKSSWHPIGRVTSSAAVKNAKPQGRVKKKR